MFNKNFVSIETDRTCTQKAEQAQQRCLGDHKGTKCTYDGRELYGEHVFELFLFSNDW